MKDLYSAFLHFCSSKKSIAVSAAILCNFVLIYNGFSQNIDNFNSTKPIKFTSGLNISTSVYSIKGSPHRQQPFNWALSGTPILSLFGIDLPFSFYYSNQALSYQQPFNQLGVSPSYKWVKAHIGYSSVNFSDYTLAGRRFLGGGVELNPGKLKFGFIYGRFQQAVEQDSVLRPTPGNFLSEFPNGAFARKGYAVKLGYGTKDNFVDFIVMQAADDSTSLVRTESLNSIDPESNMVFGLKYRIKFGSNISWETDAGLSYFTRNTRFSPIDTFNLIPKFSGLDFQPRPSSQLLYAGNSQLSYQSRNFKFGLRYRRIARDFKTMGAYYFQTDIEEYGFNTQAFLFKRKVNFRFSLGLQNDNLDGTRIQTTSRVVAAGNLGWQVTQALRLDFISSNFDIQQRNTITGLVDSLRVDQVSQSYQLQGRYNIFNRERPQSIGLSFSIQSLAPRTRNLEVIVDTRAYQTLLYYSYMIPAYRLGLTGNIHSLIHTMENGTTKSQGGGVNASYALDKSTWSFQSGFRFYRNRFRAESIGNTITIETGINGKITDKWSINLQFRILNTKGSLSDPEASFTEMFAQINTGLLF